jgi:hypothetical protein
VRLEIGAALLLVAPLVYVERLVERQIGELRDELQHLRQEAQSVAAPYEWLATWYRAGAPGQP